MAAIFMQSRVSKISSWRSSGASRRQFELQACPSTRRDAKPFTSAPTVSPFMPHVLYLRPCPCSTFARVLPGYPVDKTVLALNQTYWGAFHFDWFVFRENTFLYALDYRARAQP